MRARPSEFVINASDGTHELAHFRATRRVAPLSLPHRPERGDENGRTRGAAASWRAIKALPWRVA